jgi:hypothetical protein
MLSKLSDRFYAWTTGRRVLSVFVVLVLFMALTLPLLSRVYPDADEMTSLDDPVLYTPAEIFLILDDWGADGRAYQLGFHLTCDLVFPVLGFLLVALSLSWLLWRAVRPGSNLRRLNLLALGTVFDLLENVCLVSMIAVYPARPAAFAWLKIFFTMSKYGFMLLIGLAVVIGFGAAVMKGFKVEDGMADGRTGPVSR